MENKCETCGKHLKEQCAECESDASEQGKCADCGSEDRSAKCSGCDAPQETCSCEPDETEM